MIVHYLMLIMLFKNIVLCSASRNALCGAYDLLNIDDSGITFEYFILFMEEYQPERGT